MKHKVLYLTITIFVLIFSLGGLIAYRFLAPLNVPDLGAQSINHQAWTSLLKKHVKDGHVNYSGFIKDRPALEQYLASLRSHPPSKSWTNNEKLAYWINTYNAYTIELILRHWPITGIRQVSGRIQMPFVNSPWDIPIIPAGDAEITLNDVEHRILRKQFEDPRIHFAIVCASKSCPNLRSEAYTANLIDQQLNDQAIKFINDPSKNVIEQDTIRISRIFQWFRGDFEKNHSLVDFLNQYSNRPIDKKVVIRHLEYDWSLNE